MSQDIVKNHIERLAERSGFVTTTDPLVEFVYLLLDKHLTAREMEDLMIKVERDDPFRERHLPNGFVGEYAMDIAVRLTDGDEVLVPQSESKDEEE